MNNIEIKINKKSKMVDLSKTFLGNEGESLQGKLIFSFDEFIEGQARLEFEIDGKTDMIFLERVGETYQAPILSKLTKKGQIDMQLVITEGTSEDEVAIFKSNVFYIYCNYSINAESEQPEEYPSWIEIANTKLNQFENVIQIIETEGTGKRFLSDDGTYKIIQSSENNTNGSTTNYENMENLPSINNVKLIGNKTLDQLGIQPKGDYALSSAIPTKTSNLTNDSGFITSYTEVDPTVPDYVKAITQADINKWNNGGSLLSVETITINNDGSEVVTIPVTGLSLDLTSYSAKVGDSFYINPVVNPNNATNKKVSWKSNNTGVAKVDSGGFVETISEGNAIITCTTDDGGFTATCSVSVEATGSGEEDTTIDVTSVTLDKTSLTLKVDETATLVATVLPTNATNKNVTWTSSDNTKANVSNGIVTAIAEGNVTITAKSVSNSSISATCSVTIEAKEQEPSDEPTSGTKIQYTTLERTSGGIKADGTPHTLGYTYHTTIPYTEGMYIRTIWKKAWNAKTYPPILVVTGDTYTTPEFVYMTNDDGTDKKVGLTTGTLGNVMEATLSGYASGSSVIVNMLYDGNASDEKLNELDALYYIVGGGN